jgi:circadian clock protein KaiC
METDINYLEKNTFNDRGFKAPCKLERISTGIKGFDAVIGGGFPQGRTFLVQGGAGTGKTVFLNEFIYHGIKDFNENGVYITLEEKPSQLMRNVLEFGWNYDEFIENHQLSFVDLTPDVSGDVIETDSHYSLEPILNRIKYAVKKVNAQRVVIDGMANLFSRFSNKDALRKSLFQTSHFLKQLNVTTVLSSEDIVNNSDLHFQEYLVDGVVQLIIKAGEQRFIRKMFVKKLRGTYFRSGIVCYDISQNGLEVFSKIPIDTSLASVDLNKRLSSGIEGFDDLLDGGIPQGHMVLVSGNTGSGKTTFAMQFLNEGLKNGETTVFVALEEHVDQLKKTALVHDWNFQRYEDEGKLIFISSFLIDTRPDKVLSEILETVKDNNATRIVVDSVSSLKSALLNKESVRQMLIQLTGFLKSQGVTCLLNYLDPDMFSSGKENDFSVMQTNQFRLSSITDGIIIMRYIQSGKKISKILNVIKMRGVNHSRDIIPYEIGQKGIVIKYDSSDSLKTKNFPKE